MLTQRTPNQDYTRRTRLVIFWFLKREMKCVWIGLGLILGGLGTRSAWLGWRNMARLARITGKRLAIYPYKGGFDPKMNTREACLILGLFDHSSNHHIRTAHRTVLMANHPDKNGSRYLSSKINEAKTFLDNHR